MVRILPARATTNPAPAESLTSLTVKLTALRRAFTFGRRKQSSAFWAMQSGNFSVTLAFKLGQFAYGFVREGNPAGSVNFFGNQADFFLQRQIIVIKRTKTVRFLNRAADFKSQCQGAFAAVFPAGCRYGRYAGFRAQFLQQGYFRGAVGGKTG